MEKFALVISIFSMLIAVFSLGWNVYKDVIMKPRVKVRFSVSSIVHDSSINGDTFISLNAVNMGPGPITLSMPTSRDASIWKRITGTSQSYVIIPNFKHPICFKLPHKLEMAEQAQLVFPYEEGCFLKDEFTHIGISDSFGRIHWAPKKDIEEAKEQYRKDFKQEES